MLKNAPIQAAEKVLKASQELSEAIRDFLRGDSPGKARDAAEALQGSGKPPEALRKNIRNKPLNKCGACGEYGHNKRTCGKPQKEAAPRGPRKKTPEERQEDLKQKYPGLLELLGQVPDAEIARRYGVSTQLINSIRNKLGVTASTPKFVPTPEFLAALGTRSDYEISEDFGVSANTVANYRNRNNIPPWSPWMGYEKKLKHYLHLIGKISDPKLAKMAGVTTRIVYDYRLKNGIKTEIIAPTHKDFAPIDRDMIRELFEKGLSDKEIAKAVGSTPGTIGMIRTRDLGLLRGSAPARASEEERSEILRVFEEFGGNYTETARRVGRSATSVRRLVERGRERPQAKNS